MQPFASPLGKNRTRSACAALHRPPPPARPTPSFHEDRLNAYPLATLLTALIHPDRDHQEFGTED